MIIGHVGVAFATKWRWPRVSLTALLFATFGPDILRELLAVFFVPFALTNLYLHALPWSALLALAAGMLAWAWSRDRTTAFVVFGVVLSHVALDMISGKKPLWNYGPRGIDLGLIVQVELLVESLLLLGGWYLVRRVNVVRWL